MEKLAKLKFGRRTLVHSSTFWGGSSGFRVALTRGKLKSKDLRYVRGGWYFDPAKAPQPREKKETEPAPDVTEPIHE